MSNSKIEPFQKILLKSSPKKCEVEHFCKKKKSLRTSSTDILLQSSTCYVGMGFRCPLWCIECVMGRLGSCQQGIAHNSSQWEMDIRYSWAVTSGAGAQKMGETEEN